MPHPCVVPPARRPLAPRLAIMHRAPPPSSSTAARSAAPAAARASAATRGSADVLCVGGGVGAGYLAHEFALLGEGRRLTIVSAEAALLYERPVLSKRRVGWVIVPKGARAAPSRRWAQLPRDRVAHTPAAHALHHYGRRAAAGRSLVRAKRRVVRGNKKSLRDSLQMLAHQASRFCSTRPWCTWTPRRGWPPSRAATASRTTRSWSRRGRRRAACRRSWAAACRAC